MKWIIKTNRVLRASGCRNDQKVIYVSQVLKVQALIWWERVCQTLGDDVEANMSLEEFIKHIKANYCAPRDIKKMVDKFFDLKKGELAVE